jgi:hypothetical protein
MAPVMASMAAPIEVLAAVLATALGACRAPRRAPRAGCGMPLPRVSVPAVPGASGVPGVAPDVRPGCQAPGSRHADGSTLHAAIKAQRAAAGLDGRPSGLPLASVPPSAVASAARAAWPCDVTTASRAERAAERFTPDICDLWDVLAGFSIFEDVSSLPSLGRTFYPSQRLCHRATDEFSQVELPRRTPFRRVNHVF